MKNIKFRYLLFFSIILSSYIPLAQVIGRTVHADSKKIVPYVHYTIDDTIHGISNFEGIFEVKHSFQKIHFYHPLHHHISIPYAFLSKTDTNKIIFSTQKELTFIENPDPAARQLMVNVFRNRQQNHPKKVAPYYYETYNKFSIETNKITEAKGYINKFLKYISEDTEIKKFDSDHHLVISESTSRTRYLNALHEDEFITASKVSGVKTPLLITANAKLQSVHVYDKFIRVASKNYVNPIVASSRHNFEILDSLPTPGDTMFLVSFFPKKGVRFESLKGLLYVSSKNWAIHYAILQPVLEQKIKTTYLFESEWMEEKKLWFPKHSYVRIEADKLTLQNINLTTISHSLIHNVVIDTSFQKKQFNEIYMDYDTISYPNSYWKTQRKLPFTKKDKNTYTFYDTVGSLNNLDRAINLGERIRRKQIPYKYVYVTLGDVLKYNKYEGLRLGLGFTTNHKFSKIYEFHPFVGYGFKDQTWKYGISAKYLLPMRLKSFFYAHFQRDVQESGDLHFAYNKPLFSSEWLRALQVYRMDWEEKTGLGLQIQPHKYLYLSGEVNSFVTEPKYDYQFKDNTENIFKYDEMQFGLKYAFGEEFFRLLHEKISLGNKYPSFWLHYHQGITNLIYYKINSKLEYRHVFMNGGISTVQLVGGWLNGDVPYFLLFNAKGSLGINSVAHNSFETMGYNEFVSSDFVNLFYSYNFGYWNFFNSRRFRPRLEIAFNAGWGTLKNKYSHQLIDIKTMEKGYFETGFLMNNALAVKLYGLKVGLGLGYYIRLGAYAHERFTDNSFIKVATTFNL